MGIKKYTILLFLLIASERNYADSYDDLYIDLENMWLPGRRSVYLGIDYYLNVNGHRVLTNNKNDFFIDGRGFFVVYDDDKNRTFLTRNGAFQFNLRGYLVTADGYYVLEKGSTKNEIKYIYHGDLFDKNKEFNNMFFIAFPEIDSIKYITSKYMMSNEIVSVNNFDIKNMCLEIMPISLDNLLDKALVDVYINSNYQKANEIIQIIRKRYNEIRELNIADDDYYNNLLVKINNFENRLLTGRL
jgi:hypothetical protein